MRKFKKLLLIVFFVLFFVGCANNKENHDNNYEFYKSDIDTFKITTDYCTLYYPEKWKNNVNISIYENPYYVKFSATIDKQEIPMFSIYFNYVETGNYLGQFILEGEEIKIYYVDYSDNFPTNLSNEDFNLICQMNEDINVVISNLVYKNGLKLYK